MPKPTELIVASYNIHKGVGTDRRRDLLRTAKVIAEVGADVMAIQEADKRFGDRAGLLDLTHLRETAGLIPVPINGLRAAAHGWHGNLILVREAEVRDVHHITLPGLEPRGALMTEMEVNGHPLRVVAAHFGLLHLSRRQQVRALLDKMHDIDTIPTLLMGDLNEWRIGSRSSLVNFDKHFTAANFGHSFPAHRPMLPLDRIMIGPKGKLSDCEVHDTPLARVASDHLPVKARLMLGGAGGTP
jgi:endonuclease/exonuclease/phosphatase family metal-dependent hydrolase